MVVFFFGGGRKGGGVRNQKTLCSIVLRTITKSQYSIQSQEGYHLNSDYFDQNNYGDREPLLLDII